MEDETHRLAGARARARRTARPAGSLAGARPGTRVRRLLVIDLDDPRARGPHLTAEELVRLRAAVDAGGYALAVATSADRDAVEAALAAAAGGEALPLFALLALNDDEGSRARTAPARLATICRRERAAFASTAVVATRPEDLPLMLEAGRALALADAGAACRAAADLCLASRAEGGLIAALELLDC